jgi:hypothetical protein
MLINDPNKDTILDSCNPSSSGSSAASVTSGHGGSWSAAAFIGFGIRGSFGNPTWITLLTDLPERDETEEN